MKKDDHLDSSITNFPIPVNDDELESGNIQRCPHDEENPYTMIRNELIRDASISPDCRWLIIYLLSNDKNWKINIKQVVNHCKPSMGRNRVYKLFDEAIAAGYIQRIEIHKRPITKNGKPGGKLRAGFRYIVSETPKFKGDKKIDKPPHSPKNPPVKPSNSGSYEKTRLPENGDTGKRDSKNGHYKNKQEKNEHVKEETTPPIPPQNPLDFPKKEEAKEMAAKAAEIEVVLPHKKIKREAPEFTPKVRSIGQEMINRMVAVKPDYCPPRNLSPFLTHVDYLLRLDRRDPQKLLDVFSWALADNFWSDKMFKPNPAEYLRKQFDQLDMKMQKSTAAPQKERRFAPCSDDRKAFEAISRMNEGAL